MIKENKRSVFFLTTTFLISSLLLITVSSTFIATGQEKDETSNLLFPFAGAKAIYTVEGSSPFGHLLGTITYRVDAVNKSSYRVTVTNEGNISKIPSLVNSDTRELQKGESLSFSSVLEKSTLAEERTLKTEDREIKVDKYVLESKKEYGREKITIFIPEKVKIPLIINYRYGDRFNVVIELDKTNVKYLQ